VGTSDWKRVKSQKETVFSFDFYIKNNKVLASAHLLGFTKKEKKKKETVICVPQRNLLAVIKKKKKLTQYNNCTTTPHIKVAPSTWDSLTLM
jgi:hypothetical protein